MGKGWSFCSSMARSRCGTVRRGNAYSSCHGRTRTIETAAATGREKWVVPYPQVPAVRFATTDTVAVDGWIYHQPARPLIDTATGKARPLPGAMGEVKQAAIGLGRGETRDTLLAVSPDGTTA